MLKVGQKFPKSSNSCIIFTIISKSELPPETGYDFIYECKISIVDGFVLNESVSFTEDTLDAICDISRLTVKEKLEILDEQNDNS